MKSNTLSLILVPVISAFLTIGIVTTAPMTVLGDLDQTSVPVTPISTTTSTSTSNPSSSLTPTATAPAAPALAPTTAKSAQSISKAVPSHSKSTISTTPKKIRTQQPSRSSSAFTKASSIIATGEQYIGVKYLYGGTTPSGFDCSGFVQYVFAKNGITLPRVSRDQFRMGTAVSYNNLQAGDLVFFSLANNGVVDHEGIYVGNGKFLNAASSKGVTIYTLGSYWQSAYVGARRVL